MSDSVVLQEHAAASLPTKQSIRCKFTNPDPENLFVNVFSLYYENAIVLSNRHANLAEAMGEGSEEPRLHPRSIQDLGEEMLEKKGGG